MHASLASTAVLLLASLSLVQAQSSQCYRRTADKISPQQTAWTKCPNTAQSSGGAELCCLDDSECGEDSICRSNSTKTGESRWYVGGCTDVEFNDPVCRRDCSQYKMTFITYSSSQWQCCGNSGCDEGSNTDQTFTAVSPSQWSPITSTSKPSSEVASSDDLNLGEKIGIGVAAGVVAIALLAAGIFWFRKGTKRSRSAHRGVRGRYEEIGMATVKAGERAPSPQPYAARDTSPQPYGRSTSPVPPVRGMESQRPRSRGRSPAADERSLLPTVMQPGKGDGPAAPDSLSLFSRDGRE